MKNEKYTFKLKRRRDNRRWWSATGSCFQRCHTILVSFVLAFLETKVTAWLNVHTHKDSVDNFWVYSLICCLQKKSHRHTIYVIINTKYQTDIFNWKRWGWQPLFFLFKITVYIFCGEKTFWSVLQTRRQWWWLLNLHLMWL